jgi:hypothetical protein
MVSTFLLPYQLGSTYSKIRHMDNMYMILILTGSIVCVERFSELMKHCMGGGGGGERLAKRMLARSGYEMICSG